jgi:hypothetical protein
MVAIHTKLIFVKEKKENNLMVAIHTNYFHKEKILDGDYPYKIPGICRNMEAPHYSVEHINRHICMYRNINCQGTCLSLVTACYCKSTSQELRNTAG